MLMLSISFGLGKKVLAELYRCVKIYVITNTVSLC